MADKKCGLRYCDATVANYNEIKNILKCKCITCLGEKCDECDLYKKSQELQTDLQKQMCSKCKFSNVR